MAPKNNSILLKSASVILAPTSYPKEDQVASIASKGLLTTESLIQTIHNPLTLKYKDFFITFEPNNRLRFDSNRIGIGHPKEVDLNRFITKSKEAMKEYLSKFPDTHPPSQRVGLNFVFESKNLEDRFNIPVKTFDTQKGGFIDVRYSYQKDKDERVNITLEKHNVTHFNFDKDAKTLKTDGKLQSYILSHFNFDCSFNVNNYNILIQSMQEKRKESEKYIREVLNG